MKLVDILESHKPVLVNFSSEGCEPCKIMPAVLKQLSGLMQDSLRIFIIDIDKNGALAEFYNIQSVPTLILYMKGKPVWRRSGVFSAELLKVKLDKYIEPKLKSKIRV